MIATFIIWAVFTIQRPNFHASKLSTDAIKAWRNNYIRVFLWGGQRYIFRFKHDIDLPRLWGT